MKNLNGRNWFLLILGAIALVFFVVLIFIILDYWWLCLIGIGAAAFLILIALKPVYQSKSANAEVVEGKFLYIGMQNSDFTGAAFEVNGKEKRLALPKSVYSGNRLAPGAMYKITFNNKNNQIIAIERID